MCDLDQLSREIAATTDEWLLPGVEALRNGQQPVRVCRRVFGIINGMTPDGCPVKLTTMTLMRPNLRDRVTRNALLEDRRVSEQRFSSDIGDYFWCGPIDARGNGEIGATVIEAICRAYVAQHKAPAA